MATTPTFNFSNSTTPVPPAVISLTPFELWLQLAVCYGFIAGIIGTVLSVMICVAIVRNKKLRTRFFVIIGCLTFSRAPTCIAHFTMFLYRTLRTLGVVSINQKRIVCHCVHFFILYSAAAEMTILCILVIDRILAITKIAYYRTLKPGSAFQCCIFAYVIMALVKLIPSYLGIDLLESWPCINWENYLNRIYVAYYTNLDLSLAILTLLLYLALILAIRINVRALQRSDGTEGMSANRMAIERPLKVIPLLRNLVLMHSGLTLTSKLLLWLGAMMPKYQQRLVATGASLVVVDIIANHIMLIITNEDIRAAVIPCYKGTQVQPISGTGTRTRDNRTTNRAQGIGSRDIRVTKSGRILVPVN